MCARVRVRVRVRAEMQMHKQAMHSLFEIYMCVLVYQYHCIVSVAYMRVISTSLDTSALLSIQLRA